MPELYQLATKQKKLNGDYFFVNGPYDKHGYVLSSTERKDKFGRTEYLNLVRGTGNKKVTKDQLINTKFFKVERDETIYPQKTHWGYDYKALRSLSEASETDEIKVNALRRRYSSGGYAIYKVLELNETSIKIQNTHNSKTYIIEK